MASDQPFPFPEYAPDQSSIGSQLSDLISGCVPRADGYGPFASLQAFTQALPAACRGYAFARKSDGSIAVFAGTATKLYLLNNTSFAWTDVSKGAASYSNLVAGDNWQMKQFGDLVIAVQTNTVPQKYSLSGGGAFADLGGSPPQASHIAIINLFVVLTGLTSNNRRVQWSDLSAPETWTAGVGLSDFQDLPDGGTCQGIVGGDAYGLVFQSEPIRSFVYNPGSPAVFQITKIAEQDTLFAQYSAVQGGDRSFYCSAQGFKMVVGAGGTPIPIGKERVDRTFFADVDTANLQLMLGVIDPNATRVYWAYKSKQGMANLFDKVLCFDWGIGKNGQWSLLPISGEFLASLAKPGLTLEQLDAIAPTPLPITGAANNGAGLIRLALAGGLSNANFNIVGQNFIVVQGVTGTVEAIGSWKFTVIDATHIDLIGSAFVHPYAGGGAIGGSLDALPFSLDSVSTAATAALSAFTSDHKAGFFNGANIEAIVETSEQDAHGNLIFVSGLRLMTDCPDALGSLAYRNRQIDTSVYSVEQGIKSQDGSCDARVEARYIKARARLPAGSVWTYVQGVQTDDAQISGER